MSPAFDVSGSVEGWLARFWRDAPLVRWASLAAAGVLVVGLAGLGVWKWQDMREQRARQALAEAAQLAAAAQPPAAPAPALEAATRALEGVMGQYPGSVAAGQAAYRLGNLHFGAGRFAQARTAYEIAAAATQPGALRALSALGIAYAWEAERQWARAVTAYQALVNEPTAGFLKPEALAGLGRSQEQAGDRRAALATWEQLRKDFPDSRPAGEIDHRIASLQEPAAAKP